MSKPNILLITSDQQHWNTLGRLNPEIYTPNLDRLAAEGTLYTRAYCTNPTCTPTRATLLTGKYASQHGAYSLGTKLPEFEATLNDRLREHGYHTALIGKAHFQPLQGTEDFPSLEAYPILQDLDFWRAFDEPFYGFDHVELARNHTDEAHVGQHYVLWMEEQGLTNWRDYFRPPTGNNDTQHHKWLIPEEFHYNAWISERTCAMLDSYHAANEPFFLWASFFDPHPDYLVPEPWDTMYDPRKITVPTGTAGEHAHNPPHFQLTQQENPDFSAWEEPGGNLAHGFHSHLHDRDSLAQDIAIYYGMVSCLDKYVGQIVAHLDQLGLGENTLIVFTSDHGHYFGQHGLIAKGAFHYDDGVRVPMIVRWPGHVPAGVQSDSLQSLVDYAPTFLGACDIDIPAEMTGINQLPVWQGHTSALRDWAIVENRHQPTTIHMKTYVNLRYKLTVYFEQDYGELFDLVADPQETCNRWDDPDYGDLKAKLFEDLLYAEIRKEEPLTAETALLPNKSEAMYQKRCQNDRYEIIFDPAAEEYALFDLQQDPSRTRNLWQDPAASAAQQAMVRYLLFARMGAEPLWMPRIARA